MKRAALFSSYFIAHSSHLLLTNLCFPILLENSYNLTSVAITVPKTNKGELSSLYVITEAYNSTAATNGPHAAASAADRDAADDIDGTERADRAGDGFESDPGRSDAGRRGSGDLGEHSRSERRWT